VYNNDLEFEHRQQQYHLWEFWIWSLQIFDVLQSCTKVHILWLQ
jgi:hypothetical protein